jgi:two-component system chemotaxis response regulator CheY
MTVSKEIPILIVDDNKTVLRIVRSLLGQNGFHNIDEASDGQAALEKMQEKAFGLIISDWNMEPVSGLELLKTLRANEKTKNIPFIMVTAESKPENIMAAKEAGVTNFIVKPFSSETLKSKLSSILGPFT